MTAGDAVYVERSDGGLLARTYRPPHPNGVAIVDVHGGAWSSGDRTNGARYASHLADHGFTVVSIDFRQGPVHRHPAALEDVCSAIEWAGALPEIDRDRIGIVGSSSGGHLGLLAAISPALARPPIRGVVALWPPVDPLARYRFAIEQAETGDERLRSLYAALRRGGEGYFGDEETMAAASIARIVRNGGAAVLPPLFVARAGRDTNVPATMLDDLRDAYAEAGGEVTLVDFPDQPHGFGHRAGPETDRLLGLLVEFFTSVAVHGGT